MGTSTFDVARMQALKTYAELELEVCLVLRAVLDVEPPIASTIFYHITNTRARYAIISSLLEMTFPVTFAKAWPKLEKWLTPRDTARNHIIHWGQDTRLVVLSTAAHNLSEGGVEPVIVQQELGTLSNSAKRWREKSGSEKVYTETDVRNENARMQAMEIIIRRYHASITHPGRWPWSGKFQQPITDQTPEEFLSRLDDIEPPDPPQSSQE